MGFIKDLGKILDKGKPSKDGHIHVKVSDLQKLIKKGKEVAKHF